MNTLCKYTPGPWHLSYRNAHTVQIYARLPQGERVVAEVTADEYAEVEPDARLIAALPDLLEIVEAVARFDGRNTGVPARLKEMAQAAIAKAIGSTNETL